MFVSKSFLLPLGIFPLLILIHSEWTHSNKKLWKKFIIIPWLKTGDLVTLESYNGLPQRYPFRSSDGHPSLWSYDCMVGTWQLAWIDSYLQQLTAIWLHVTTFLLKTGIYFCFLAKTVHSEQWIGHKKSKKQVWSHGDLLCDNANLQLTERLHCSYKL